MIERLFVALQYCLPRHLLTAIVYRLARLRSLPVKNFLIRTFVRLYKVDLDEVDGHAPDEFASLNDFFTRELVDGARPVSQAPATIVSPVDGTVSIATRIDRNNLFQAKGFDYTLDELFTVDLATAEQYVDGIFTTIYLAPHNYHRVHMPVGGKLVAAHYVPGDLFSVNRATVARVPGLFYRNERLNLHFETASGPMALIFVGALNVGSISTPWTGEIRPRSRGIVETQTLSRARCELEKGELLGWFNMGSTVVLLLPKETARWDETLQTGRQVRMGESIGTLLSRQ